MGILSGGVNARMFCDFSGGRGGFGMMVMFSEWRRERIFAYMDPWNKKIRLGKATSCPTLDCLWPGSETSSALAWAAAHRKLHWLPSLPDFL
jgi:cell division protein FtsW